MMSPTRSSSTLHGSTVTRSPSLTLPFIEWPRGLICTLWPSRNRSIAIFAQLIIFLSLLYLLQTAGAELFDQVIASPSGQRHHGERRVLAAVRHESGAVGDAEILDVVRLVEFVQDRGLRVVAHSRGADFVDAEAGDG